MATDWQAIWIELPTHEMPNYPSYSIEMDFRIANDDAGIIFVGKTLLEPTDVDTDILNKVITYVEQQKVSE